MSNLLLILKLFKFWVAKKNPIFEIFMKKRKVLDVGCGEGKLIKMDKENIYGIDINKTMAEKLQIFFPPSLPRFSLF